VTFLGDVARRIGKTGTLHHRALRVPADDMHEKHLYGRRPGGFHRIAYTEWGQASAQPPVICVHGLVRNGRDFDYLARA